MTPTLSSQPTGHRLGRVSVAGLHLGGWIVYGVVYYLTLRPYQPFADLLWKQTLVAAGTGVLLSTLLGVGYWTVGLRQKSALTQSLTIVAGALTVGLVWYQVKEWGVDWVDPFIAPVTGTGAFRPGEGSLLSAASAFPVLMLVWSGVYLTVAQRLEQRRQERRLLEADAEAQRAQLRALRYQLNPHFFFNALNTVGALADEAPHRVKKAVRELSGFLRYTLLDDESLVAPLGDEIEAAEHYLAVEKIRFEDDLDVEIDVDADAARCTVPSFLVLPLVENAVKHGHRTSPSPLHVRISGTRTAEALVLEVANTGHWRQEHSPSESTDTGLDNVRARLEAHYPNKHRFTIDEEEDWVRVRIEIDTTALPDHE